MPDAPKVQPAKAVYYPHVEFGSTAWVKSALLYWDGMVRPRPPQTSPRDDPEVKQLIAEGLIEEVSPAPFRQRYLPEIGRRFEALLRKRGGHLPKCIPGIRAIRGTQPEREERVRAVIVEKLRPLAQKAFVEDADRARALFLTLWANIVARERQFAPVTDDPIFDAIMTYGEHGKITRDLKELTQADGHAIAQLCLPIPSLEAIAELPVARLLDIRRKYAAQRRRFRENVQAQLTAITRLPTRQAIEEQLRSFREEIRDNMEAAREAVRDAKTKDRWSLLGVSAPASLAAGISIAGASPVLGPVAGVGTFALGVTSWFMQRRKGGFDPESHYLLSVEGAATAPWQKLAHALGDLVHE